MTWNYRVVKKDNQLTIHGVYYNEDGKLVSIDEAPNFPYGEDLDELKNRLNLMNESLNKSIVDFETLVEIK